jgi:hypothetical protein
MSGGLRSNPAGVKRKRLLGLDSAGSIGGWTALQLYRWFVQMGVGPRELIEFYELTFQK